MDWFQDATNGPAEQDYIPLNVEEDDAIDPGLSPGPACIDPRLTVSPASSPPTQDSPSSDSETEADPSHTSKRRTRLRRRVEKALDSLPLPLVSQFWTAHQRLHAGSCSSSSSSVSSSSSTGEGSLSAKETMKLLQPFVKDDRGRKKCVLCGHTAANYVPMQQHLLGVHFDYFEHRCAAPLCAFSSTRRADLKRHQMEQHESSWRRFKCPRCKSLFKHSKNLKRHIRNVHSGKQEGKRRGRVAAE